LVPPSLAGRRRSGRRRPRRVTLAAHLSQQRPRLLFPDRGVGVPAAGCAPASPAAGAAAAAAPGSRGGGLRGAALRAPLGGRAGGGAARRGAPRGHGRPSPEHALRE
jgi:hypothetical protein